MFISNDPLVNRRKRGKKSLKRVTTMFLVADENGLPFIYDVSNFELVKMLVSLHVLENKIIN